MKLLPVPLLQLAPASVLYCQVAPASRPLTATVPTLLTPSLLLLPLSVLSAKVGAAGAVASKAKVNVLLICEKWPPMF